MTKDNKQELIKQAEALGIDVKGNWGIPKLTEEIKKATKSKEEVVHEDLGDKEIVEKVEEPRQGKWLYKGDVISTDKLLELLQGKLTKIAAEDVANKAKTGRPYAVPTLGYITYLG